MKPTNRESSESRADSGRISRRGLLGLTATVAGVGIGGAYGLQSMSQPARAQTTLTFEDNTVVLEEDEEISSVTIAGTVEAYYDAGDDEADNAGLRVMIGNLDGPVPNDSRQFSYDSIDPDSDTFTEAVAFEIDLPSELADPDPGEATETEFIVEAFFGVDRAEPRGANYVIIEDRTNDTAVLRIEREAEDDDDANRDSPDSDSPEANIGGSFSFEIETE